MREVNSLKKKLDLVARAAAPVRAEPRHDSPIVPAAGCGGCRGREWVEHEQNEGKGVPH